MESLRSKKSEFLFFVLFFSCFALTLLRNRYMRPMDAFLSSKSAGFSGFLNLVASLPANMPPPLPSFDSLPTNESQVAIVV